MEQWVYFIHAPREHFADTMTEDEQAVWGEHVQRLTMNEDPTIAPGIARGELRPFRAAFIRA